MNNIDFDDFKNWILQKILKPKKDSITPKKFTLLNKQISELKEDDEASQVIIENIFENLNLNLDYWEAKRKYTDWVNTEKPHSKTNTKNSFNSISLGVLMEMELPEIEWHIHKLLPKGGILVVGGEQESYKSWLMLHAAICCATGNAFLNHGVFHTEECKILFIDEENDLTPIKHRMKLLLKGMGLEQDHKVMENIFIASRKNAIFDNVNGFKRVKDHITIINPQVVFIDSMSRCMDGEEDKVKNVREIFNNFKLLFKEFPQISFVLLHHTTKGKGKKGIAQLRGSGDFAAFSDVVLMLNRGFRKVYVTIGKSRHIERERLPCFGIEIDNPTKDSIVFHYTKKGKPQELADEVSKDLINWLQEEELLEFRTGAAEKAMKNLGYTRDAFYKGLAKLKKTEELKCLKKGHYKVDKSIITLPKEAQQT